ncbi:MAG: hypothetical protein Ta2E_05900 [Mycoplasmoidaceae bacterium]|nr:MAG: hypothetical protein Ta2E_05900 [Mycoplasmoidaceae bacterium]
MKNNKTFKYAPLATEELDRLRLEPTANIKASQVEASDDEFNTLSSDVLEYKLKNLPLTKAQKKQIKTILKNRK